MLEYIYNKPMRMKDLSCVGFHFSLTSFGELQSNFTFRFPAMTGHFYHVPTFSLISDQNQAIWDTQFRGGKSHSLKQLLPDIGNGPHLNQVLNNQRIFNIILLIVELASLILGTDYTSWAVLAQCNKNSADAPSPRYLSTR